MTKLEEVKGEFRSCFSELAGNKAESNDLVTQFYIEKTKCFNHSLEALLLTIDRINSKHQNKK